MASRVITSTPCSQMRDAGQKHPAVRQMLVSSCQGWHLAEVKSSTMLGTDEARVRDDIEQILPARGRMGGIC
jgi:hypothetical protein